MQDRFRPQFTNASHPHQEEVGRRAELLLEGPRRKPVDDADNAVLLPHGSVQGPESVRTDSPPAALPQATMVNSNAPAVIALRIRNHAACFNAAFGWTKGAEGKFRPKVGFWSVSPTGRNEGHSGGEEDQATEQQPRERGAGDRQRTTR